MDEKSQRKVMEGSVSPVEETKRETKEAISSRDLKKTKYNLRLFKKSLEIIRGLWYVPSEDSKRLHNLYSDVIKDAEAVFGISEYHQKDLRKLTEVTR